MRVIISGWLLRAVLAAIFLYAGIAKLVDVRTFAADVANYRLLPSPLVAPLAHHAP